jgi:hypothetical protein
VAPGAEQLKDSESGLVADNGLAVDQAGTHRQRRDRRHDRGKALAEIVAVAGDQTHAGGVASRQDAEAVMLDLVQPVGTARRGFGWRRQAGFNQAGYAADTL